MSRFCRNALLVAASVVLGAAAARPPSTRLATGHIAVAPWPYLPGSVIPLRVSGFAPPFETSVLGSGRVADGSYTLPLHVDSSRALLIAGNAAGLATASIRIAGPRLLNRPLLIVASYEDGLVFHDAASFSVLGVLATGGTPADVAVDRAGRVATPDTQGTTLAVAALAPWNVTTIGGVVLGDEVAIDDRSRAIFVTDRDVDGRGALTRVTSEGIVTRVTTGATAEGLAVDERRGIVYVANANDGTIAAVDARSMRILRRIPAVNRVFSIALSSDGDRLYAVSNQSANSPFGAAGSVVALALAGSTWRRVARSGNLAFPLGAALDSSGRTLFVTDEERAQIDVLDARSLRAQRSPLRTCATPWKPLVDAAAQMLYVPCAGSDEVDAFDVRTLRRVARAPFRTGGYPLAVAAWRPTERPATSQRPIRSARGKT